MKGQTIALNGTEIALLNAVTIDASSLYDAENDAPGLTLDAGGLSRVFYITGGTAENPVELNGLKIVNGSALHGGGVMVYANSALSASDCVFVDNKTTNTGGGLCVDGWANLERCVVSGNASAENGGGIFVASIGSLTMTETTISGNSAKYGGGLIVVGSATLSDSTISDNAATNNGGGVYVNNAATATFADCAIVGNSAVWGGGLQTWGTVEIVNSAIVGNSSTSGGGGMYLGATATITNATIAGNNAGWGGGFQLHTDVSATLYNSIVALNTASSSAQIAKNGTLTAYNTLSSYTSWDAGSSNYVYNSSKPLFTNAANGDYTLAANSQAINKGNNAYIDGFSTDLAGKTRVSGTYVDLGSYEYQQTTPLLEPSLSVSATGSSSLSVKIGSVANAASYTLEYSTSPDFTSSTTTTKTYSGSGTYTLSGLSANTTYYVRVKAVGDGTTYSDSPWSSVKNATTPNPETPSLVVTTNNDVVNNTDGLISLREAIKYAEADATLGDAITFASSLKGQTIVLSGTQLEITRAITVDASALWEAENDVPGLTLDANEQSRIFNVVGGTTENPVELIGLKIANGSAPHAGGVMIYAGAALKASDCVFVDNKTTNSGGGLYADGWADLENCLFSGNSAATAGGGVYVAATGSLTATGVEVANNSAKRGGGVSVAKNGTLTLSNSTVVNNIASAAGGGGLQLYGQATLTDSTIFGNSSPTYGGGVNVDAVATIVNCEIVGNTAKYGGGIHTDATRGVLTLTDSTVADNVATSQGGGLAGGGSETIENVVFSENLASQGGGIYASGALTATGLTIFGNTATDGGGLYVAGTGAATLADSTISNNAAGETGQGGGLYVVGTGTATLADSTISDNTAAWGGGGIVWGTATLTNALVVENTATTSGGGFYVDGTATFRNATIAANEAAGGGGLQVSNDGTTTLYNAIVATNAVSNSNYLHTNDVSDSGTFAAYNTLSSFTSWDAGSNNFVYNVAQALFADAANGDYRLAPESQALDKGNDAYAVDASGVALQTDLAGNARFVGTVDLGAYEREPAPQLSSPSLSVSGSSSSSLTLSVGSVDKASSYELQYSTSEDFATSTTLSVSSGDVVVDGLSPNATYYFRAKVLGDGLTGLDSEWSPVVAATTERVASLTVVTTNLDVVDPEDGKISLREAIMNAEADASLGGVVTFDASLKGQTIELSGTELAIAKGITVDASSLYDAENDVPGLTLNANGKSRVFNVSGGTAENPVELIGLTIAGGGSVSYGGGVYVSGTTTFTNCAIIDNSANIYGGGVYVSGASTFTDCSISHNSLDALDVWSELYVGGGRRLY